MRENKLRDSMSDLSIDNEMFPPAFGAPTEKPKKCVSFSKLLTKFHELLENEDNTLLLHKNSKKSVEARQAGNKLFDKKKHNQEDHMKLLSLYTKSISLAEENSEEMSSAYYNRSALLMHLKKYEECLVDIDKAYQIAKSDRLKKKLANLKQGCLSKLNKVEKDEQNPPPEFEFEPSKEIPCASKLVTLKYDEKFGRHVVATQDIEPGTIIAIEKGFMLFPHMEYLHLICSHCLSLAWNGIPCQSCAVAVYCSEECKKEAWQQYHDIECSILPYFDYLENYGGSLKIFGLTVRLFIKVIKTEGLANILKEAENIDQDKELSKFYDNELFQYNKFRSIYNLSEYKKSLIENHEICKMIVELLHQKTKLFNKNEEDSNLETIGQNSLISIMKVFEKLRMIAQNNSYNFHTMTGMNVKRFNFGVFIGNFCSMFNHSCKPDVRTSFTKNQEILLFTTNFINKGEQIFVNYGVTSPMTKRERQNILNKYNFICDCQVCEEDWPDLGLVSLMNYLPQYNKVLLELGEAGLWKTHLLLSNHDDWSFSKEILEDVKKIIIMIGKYFKGVKAAAFVNMYLAYIIDYYNYFYTVRNDIRSKC